MCGPMLMRWGGNALMRGLIHGRNDDSGGDFFFLFYGVDVQNLHPNVDRCDEEVTDEHSRFGR